MSDEKLLNFNMTLIFIAAIFLKLSWSNLFQYFIFIRYFMLGNHMLSFLRTVNNFVFVSGKSTSNVLNAVSTWFPCPFRIVIKDGLMIWLSLFLVIVTRNWKFLWKVNAWWQFVNSLLSTHYVACIYKLVKSVGLICSLVTAASLMN